MFGRDVMNKESKHWFNMATIEGSLDLGPRLMELFHIQLPAGGIHSPAKRSCLNGG